MGELLGCGTFVRKGAEGALADDCIKLALGKSEMLCIALLEAHSICNTGSLGSTSSRTDQILSVLDTGDFTAKPCARKMALLPWPAAISRIRLPGARLSSVPSRSVEALASTLVASMYSSPIKVAGLRFAFTLAYTN
jgi:hypothetical protein